MSSSATKMVDHAKLSDFFSRLASGSSIEYHSLAKEIGVGSRKMSSFKPSTPVASSVASEHIHRRVAPPARPTPKTDAARCDAAPAKATLTDKHQFTFKLMIHSLYTISEFAMMVTDVLTDSQSRFQPLPPSMRERKPSLSPLSLDTEAALRALKKRRVAAAQKHDTVATFLESPSPQTPPLSPTDSLFSENSSICSPMTPRSNRNDMALVSPSAAFDEEEVLDYVRGLVEERLTASKHALTDEAEKQSSSSLATSTRAKAAGEGVHGLPPPLRPSMKRRLSFD
ncbi:predicted protein [Postia placenta Mad-698-R]|uniref:Uncharacterized protein n=1 Tax=Postia placenta MAD-698-R-SB12 TaxID=670580 RepID=A0A1X6N695_9APHY|nr:hypothetical protein POSPLADRAFT_1045255 [Postia placenta MAD-698-R-SB12]EED79727.1 predicted protein [Postia placenta Mad-698-R]OSX64138.1 hypothetical protein POSPLADRAFT_1045255 [Postia placenta MAD-698-R-SB12]